MSFTVKKITYSLDLSDLKMFLSEKLNVPVDSMTIEFRMQNVSHPLDHTPIYKVGGMDVIVCNKNVPTARAPARAPSPAPAAKTQGAYSN